MNRVIAACAILCIAGASILAQGAALRMGMTRAEAVAILGKPSRCFDRTAERYYDLGLCAHLIGQSQTMDEVFTRKTQTNEFEIHAGFYPDNSQSRLHPTSRLGVLTFILDHPI